jgi:type IV secretory pathway VirB10-like protein
MKRAELQLAAIPSQPPQPQQQQQQQQQQQASKQAAAAAASSSSKQQQHSTAAAEAAAEAAAASAIAERDALGNTNQLSVIMQKTVALNLRKVGGNSALCSSLVI